MWDEIKICHPEGRSMNQGPILLLLGTKLNFVS
jgi:hypothetical protein